MSACFRSFLTPKGLPQSNNGSAPPPIPTPVSVGGNYRRCSIRLMLRPAWLLAFLDWSDLTKPVGRRRRLRPSLPQRRSLTPRVGYDYTASPEGYCGRTFTGWSAAVTGCALLRSWFLLVCDRRIVLYAGSAVSGVKRFRVLLTGDQSPFGPAVALEGGREPVSAGS